MSPRRSRHPRADWPDRAASGASNSYVRAFTRAFFGFGKDQVTAMRIAERVQLVPLAARPSRGAPEREPA